MTVIETQDNPFEFADPDVSDNVELDISDATDFCIRDEILICGPRLALPAVCWKTGATEDLEPLQFQILRGSFRLHVPPVAVSSFISRQQKRHEERRGVVWSLVSVTGTLMFVLPLILLRPGLTGSQILLGVLFSLAGAVVIVVSSLRILKGLPVVHRYTAPGQHFVSGMPSALLTQLRLLEAQRRTGRSRNR